MINNEVENEETMKLSGFAFPVAFIIHHSSFIINLDASEVLEKFDASLKWRF
jgi:hypothetical protein